MDDPPQGGANSDCGARPWACQYCPSSGQRRDRRGRMDSGNLATGRASTARRATADEPIREALGDFLRAGGEGALVHVAVGHAPEVVAVEVRVDPLLARV